MQRRNLSSIFAALLVASILVPVAAASALSPVNFTTKTTVSSTSSTQFQRVYENGTSSIIFLDGNSNGTIARSIYDVANGTVKTASSPTFVSNATDESVATTPIAAAASSTDAAGVVWYNVNTGSSISLAMDTNVQIYAQKVSSTASPIYDKPVNSVALWLSQSGSPSGNIIIGLYNAPAGGTNDNAIFTIGTIFAGSIPTTLTMLWFNSSTFILSDINYAIGVNAAGGSSGTLTVGRSSSNVVSNTHAVDHDITVVGQWSNRASDDIRGIFAYRPAITDMDDGDTRTFWRNDANSEPSAFVYSDQGSTKPVRGVRAYFNDASEIPATIDVYVSDDTGNWGSPVGTWATTNSAGWQSFNFTQPVHGRYVKLQVNTWGSDVRWRMGEFQTLVAPQINTVTVTSPVDLGRYSLQLNRASSQQVNVASSGSISFTGSSAITVMGWMKPTSLETDKDRLGFKDSTFNLQPGFGSDGTARCEIFTSSWTAALSPAGTTVANEWHHYACTYDGSTIKLYKDGVLVGSGAKTGNIGGSVSSLVVGQDTTGYIDDFMVFNTVKSQVQIQGIVNGELDTNGLVLFHDYNDGIGTSAKDLSGNSNTGTLINSPTWSSDVTTNSQSRPTIYVTGRDSVNSKLGIAKVDLADLQQIGTNVFPSTTMTSIKDIAQSTTKIYVIGRDASANLRLGILNRDMTGYTETTIVTGGVLDNVARLAVYEGSPNDTVYAFYQISGNVLKAVKYTSSAIINPAAMAHTTGDFSIIQMSGKIAIQTSGKVYELNTSTDAITEVQSGAFLTRYPQPFTISPASRTFNSNPAYMANATVAIAYTPSTGVSARTGVLIDDVNTGGSGSIEGYNPAKYYFATATDMMIEAATAGATTWTIKDPGTRQQIAVSPYSEDVGIALVQNDTIFELDVIRLVCDNGDYLIEIKYFAVGDDSDCNTWRTLDESGGSIGRDLPFARTKDLVHASQYTSYTIHMVAASDPSQFSATMQYGGKDVDYSIFDGADNANVDLLFGQCYTVVYKRINTGEVEQTDTICADDVANKEAILTAGLSFNFWTNSWGVFHRYNATTNELDLTVRHEPAPYNYTINITTAGGMVVVNNTYSASQIIDSRTLNLSAYENDEPLKLEVFAEGGRSIYLRYLDDQPLYLKWVADYFKDYQFAGWNILFFLPIIFIGAFTKNTAGVGVGITGVFIAVLDWLGVIDLPDPVIWIIVVIGIVGYIAYRKQYE